MDASGASTISILLWVRKGGRTLAEARASCRTESKGWKKCLREEYIEVGADEIISVTEAGGDYLAEETMFS